MKDEMLFADLISVFIKKTIGIYCLQGQIVQIIDPKVLGWYRERDCRPLFVDKAVCVAKISGCEYGTHIMGLFARNPGIPNQDGWHSYLVTDASFSWLEYLSEIPTLEDAFRAYGMFFSKFPMFGWERYDGKLGLE